VGSLVSDVSRVLVVLAILMMGFAAALTRLEHHEAPGEARALSLHAAPSPPPQR
jgi:hypothetical protein